MWGLGCILIEMIHGVPLWLNNRVRMTVEGVEREESGKFATESRSFIEILDRQLDLLKNKEEFFLQ